jgi:hypothetical protein
MEKNTDLLAAVEALDNGKSVGMAKGDVAAAVGCIRYYGGWADKIEGKVIETNSDTFSYTKQEPVSSVWEKIYYLGTHSNGSRLVYAVKSSHGTSQFSCGHGRLVQLLPLVTLLS